MFGDYASNLMFLPNLTRRELLHFVAGGGFNRFAHSAKPLFGLTAKLSTAEC